MRLRSVLAFAAALAPGAAHAAGGGGSDLWANFWAWFNLALLVTAVYFLARKPIRNYLSERRGAIETEIERARHALEDAEHKLVEWRSQMDQLDDELESIRGSVRAQAEGERARILEDARVNAERIRADATEAVERELRVARERLRRETADAAVRLAGELIERQVEESDRDRLAEEFVTRIERAAENGGEARS
ncbi:MAG: ATP synthase F0 subunit B [Myxococcota bacterium]|nr:ATP synthase F0 subunit B [Myxococcota bacterium]